MGIKNLLVFGATGTQGRPVVDAALRQGLNVRAASRDPHNAAQKLPHNVELARADLTDAESLNAAAEGMDAVFFHIPILPDPALAPGIVENMIASSRVAGLRRMVFTTGAYSINALSRCAFVAGIRQLTSMLLKSGLDVVVLRPTLYLANLVWPHLITEIRDHGRLSYPPLDPQRRVSWTATEDQGRLAVACLDADVGREIIDIASREAVTGPELARMLAGVYGREVHFDPHTPAEFADTLGKLSGDAGIGRDIGEYYAALDKLPPDGLQVDIDSLVRRLGVEPGTVSGWVENRLGRLIELYA